MTSSLVFLLLGNHIKHSPRRDIYAARKESNSSSTSFLPKQQQQGVSQDTAGNDPSSESSDNDLLPDVHWCIAFFCYRCWSHGRLRIPPRWRLKRVDEPDQDSTTGSSHGVPQLHSYS
ncbi:hypothetical protein AZE42_11196 [Rhizopogon vesiculosus]|uniref:Uncharacterized protein n=1 Tax=Rhizopogon vesiculosus TaxID=180088 RepID=A0A1J8QAR8_9AGAM|nr:hypothetical protein AZE42_11196 [Rhizopogon vesiculosus]